MKEKKLYGEPIVDVLDFEMSCAISESNPGPVGGGDDDAGDPD